MTALLEMPADYSIIEENELDEIDGGWVQVAIAAAGVAIAAGAGIYGAGQVAGERAYYAGLRNPAYQANKWQFRAAAVGLAGVIGGPILVTGFENKFYSMI
ncbi:class IIb bacteriocin, lactobin A/cerein 7B family [Microbacterium testaceum]|uniref:class IIb bacteriocin, lactobin A/cerein 7B family n=1 Tax=Microbacterium testaceum TaxID=2033 RepID=UPI002AC54C91|nr:class IIb bacteriocin, lactobin A/cerein 7B family [Microbacterium testaceum]MDZ5145944.1 class IIb bacteriocin, lactobin A/cerein 7B family [Microbacterium testaceum]